MKNINKVDFFLVGAARCGTTSLYNYLNGYKEIFLPNVKEPNFFSRVSSPNLEDYELPKQDKLYHNKIITSKIVYDSLYEKAKYNQLKGDTSPSYLWDKDTARRIYNHNPNAKIIISLRHPVDRAYSHYNMNYFIGVDNNKPFENALKAPKNSVWGSCNEYLEMSAYYKQVKVYYDTFPKEQIKIIVYEEWIKDIEGGIRNLLDFLEINLDKISVTNEVEHNKIKQTRNIHILNFLRKNKLKYILKKLLGQKLIDNLKTVMFEKKGEVKKLNNQTRNTLSLRFEEDNKKLEQLTNINFSNIWND